MDLHNSRLTINHLLKHHLINLKWEEVSELGRTSTTSLVIWVSEDHPLQMLLLPLISMGVVANNLTRSQTTTSKTQVVKISVLLIFENKLID